MTERREDAVQTQNVGRASVDRDIEVYKAVRAHEVMLNQAASAFEHAVIARLVALNGGAAAAFLTLLGALSKSSGPRSYQPWFAGGAVVVWSVGLLIASLAARYGFKRQQKLNEAFRIMREEIETKVSPELAQIVKVLPERASDGDKSADDRRQSRRKEAGQR